MGGPLSNVDAAWLRMEDPTNLLMVTGILVFEEPPHHRRGRSLLEARPPLCPPFPPGVG